VCFYFSYISSNIFSMHGTKHIKLHKLLSSLIQLLFICVFMDMVFICTVRYMAKCFSCVGSTFDAYNDQYSGLR
jgi:hypothetical protein